MGTGSIIFQISPNTHLPYDYMLHLVSLPMTARNDKARARVTNSIAHKNCGPRTKFERHRGVMIKSDELVSGTASYMIAIVAAHPRHNSPWLRLLDCDLWRSLECTDFSDGSVMSSCPGQLRNLGF